MTESFSFRFHAVVLSAVLLLAGAGAASADEAADRCGAAKEKAAGRYGQGVLACHSKATRDNGTLDAACVSKAWTRLAAAFAKAEAAGGCATSTDAGATASAADSDAQDVVAALTPAANEEARKCAAAKTKSAGKHYAGHLACYAKGAANSEGPDPECLGKAADKLATIYGKLDDKGGCTTTGDAASITGTNVGNAEDQVAALSPVCGDDITGPAHDCEIADDGACPGLCTAACVCSIPPSCGNGIAELPEECDDGGNADGDGCSSTCVLENATALCAGVPSFSGEGIDAVLVQNFNAPIHAAAPPLDPSRLFVVEREGVIRILDLATDTIRTTPFLDINDLTTTDGERGLLSMAFDPDYDTNRRFYVNYTNNAGHTTIARYQTSIGDPNVADESTAAILLVIDQPESNHNGGQIQFSPVDGYLYVGMGDGGGGGDPYETGQDDGELLGKMLRIDTDVAGPPYYAVPTTNPAYVDGSDELELIWSKGLRNPWRFSFDRQTGDLLIADVGQGSREEIDFASAASTGGENYGWDIFEGTMCYEPTPPAMSCPPTTGFTMPIFEYNHSGGCTSVTGGFVYRGCSKPDLHGTYFYSDVCHNWLRTIDISGGTASNPQDRTADAQSTGVSFGAVSSFAEDARGELYIVDLAGGLYRLVHDAP